MSDRYEQLKAQFIKEIIGDRNDDRPAVERKITRLRDTFFEKEERLMQSVKDVKADQDPQLKERAIGRLQEEKAALDDAILDILERQQDSTLPKLDEAVHAARKALDIPKRQASILPAAIKATLRMLAGLGIALIVAAVLYLFDSDTPVPLFSSKSDGPSFGGYVSWIGSWIGDYVSRLLNFDLTGAQLAATPIVLFSLARVWWAFFTDYHNIK